MFHFVGAGASVWGCINVGERVSEFKAKHIHYVCRHTLQINPILRFCSGNDYTFLMRWYTRIRMSQHAQNISILSQDDKAL